MALSFGANNFNRWYYTFFWYKDFQARNHFRYWL